VQVPEPVVITPAVQELVEPMLNPSGRRTDISQPVGQVHPRVMLKTTCAVTKLSLQ
jgi:hypothetical protein